MLTSTQNTWLDNSANMTGPWDDFHKAVTIIAIIISIGVLSHSAYIHSTVYSSVRILTDIASFIMLISSILLYYAYQSNDDYQHVIIINVVIYSIFRPILQLCDNYMVYSMLVFMDNLTANRQIPLILYIAMLMILSYALFGTVIPFGVDLNHGKGRLIRDLFSCLVYYVSYSALYVTFIIKLRRLLASQNNLELSTRNLVHVIVSCCGAIFAAAEILFPVMYPVGLLVHFGCIVVSLHSLFNLQKPRNLPSNGLTMLTTTKGYLNNARVAPVFWPRPINHAEISSDNRFDNFDDVVIAPQNQK